MDRLYKAMIGTVLSGAILSGTIYAANYFTMNGIEKKNSRELAQLEINFAEYMERNKDAEIDEPVVVFGDRGSREVPGWIEYLYQTAEKKRMIRFASKAKYNPLKTIHFILGEPFYHDADFDLH